MSRFSLSKHSTPPEAQAILRDLGRALRIARIRRREPLFAFANRLLVSVPTLRRMEAGDPTVAIGAWVRAWSVLDMLNQLRPLADPGSDRVGRSLELRKLPSRIRHSHGDPEFDR